MRSISFRAFRRPLIALLVCAPPILLACGSPPEPVVPQPEPVTPPVVATPTPVVSAPLAETPGEVSVDMAALDKSVAPCDDFYQYACGTWLKETPIPGDQASWGRSFNVIRERNELLLKGFLEKAAEKADGDANSKKLGAFYTSCMNEAEIDKVGAKALAPELARVAAVNNVASLTAELSHLHTTGVNAIFDFSSAQDFKNATEVIGVVSQAGLGLPDRDYYLVDDAKKKEIRATYEGHIERMLTLLGDKPADAAKNRQTVMKIETALAQASMSKVDLRDPKKIYHRIDLAGLKQTAPDFPWETYLKQLGAPGVVAINVAQPDFVKTVNGMLKSIPMADWRTYLRWHVLKGAANRMSKPFLKEDFEFRKALTGTANDLPRWKRCVRMVDGAMGEALAQPFVKDTLGDEGKATTKKMIGEIEDVMKTNLGTLSWMDDTTKGRAVEKIKLIANKIGYPDKWRSYEALTIDPKNYLANTMAAESFEVKRQLAKIGKPVDRNEWQMTPPTVNAYYDASLNEMVFPAGILQPPFYSNKATLPTNFGGIGMVMGHELTHGFDDEGRQFDGQGNLKEWWTPAVSTEFDKRAACVADQYDAYAPFPDAHVNGKLTLGENIADLGGVKLALAALRKARAGQLATQSHGFSEDQQFFLGFAQGWCTNMRDEMTRLQVATNPHSPPRYRVVGPLSNLPEFARAFSCKEGDKMVRPQSKRCEIW